MPENPGGPGFDPDHTLTASAPPPDPQLTTAVKRVVGEAVGNRIGRTAIARIAAGLTAAVAALRDELLTQVPPGEPADLDLIRALFGDFHAERFEGRTVMVARLELTDFTARMNRLAAIEREASA